MSYSNPRANNVSDDPQLDNKVLDAIGRALKAHYGDLVNAPLPERFVNLLADLEAEESGVRPVGGDNAAR